MTLRADDKRENERIESLNELAFTLINAASKQAMTYSVQALKLAEDHNIPNIIAKSYRTKGIVHWAQGAYAESLGCFRTALKIFKNLENRAGVASIHSCFGNIYLTQGLLDDALENYLEAQTINENISDSDTIAMDLLNIGNVYMRKNLFDSAICNYTKALKYWQEKGDVLRISNCFNNFGMVFRRKGEFHEALEWYGKALKIRKETGDKRGTANTIGNIGSLYEEMNDYEQALESFLSALELSESIDDKFGIAVLCCNLGHILLSLKSYDSAEAYTIRALGIAREIEAIVWEVNCLDNLSILMEKQGNLEAALKYAREYSYRRAELLNEESSMNFYRLLALYETEKKEREAENLRLKSADLEEEVKMRTEELVRMNHVLENLVCECKTAEYARKKVETNFQSFLENVDDVVYFQVLDGSISGINSACKTISGHKKEEFQSDVYLWLNLMHPDDMQSRQEFLKLDKEGEMTDTEYRITSVSGQHHWLNSRMVPVFNSDHVLIGYNCIDRDITERKEADQKLMSSIENLEKSFLGTINVISKIVETRDPHTSGHQIRTAELAKEIARQMELTENQIQAVYLAGVVHDIGKIYIPQELLSKSGALNSMEMDLIKMHPAIGFDILSNIDLPWPIADIVHQHHEMLDGSGYPAGLKGEELSIEARILCVADVIEAMSSHRPYRPSLGTEKALDELIAYSGKLYDPIVVDACRILFHEKGYSLE